MERNKVQECVTIEVPVEKRTEKKMQLCNKVMEFDMQSSLFSQQIHTVLSVNI